MATFATSDPFKILGVDTDADTVAIKKAYRKLVLSCHPDKVTDESLKEQKQEEFHQIQQAYETIGDPDNRTKYELELKAKKLKEERERTASKASPGQPRNVNINIYTAQHPSEQRSSSSKHSSPSKPSSFKPYSAEYSKSWDHNLPNRSKAYEAERKTRRTFSDERLNDDSKERRRREDDRERVERKRREEEEDRRRRLAKREKEEEREMKDRRIKEALRRKEQQERQERQEREDRQRAERKSRERADLKRRQELADEKMRAKMKANEHTSEEDEERRSRAKKASKKDSPRDKTPSKARERPSPRDEFVPEVPNPPDALATDQMESKMAYAALYIRDQQVKKNSKPSPKPTANTHSYTDAYPDPDQWVPKRRVSGSKISAEPANMESSSAPTSPQGPPPRLQKSYTMGHVPASDARPATLNRSQTLDQDAFARTMGSGSKRPGLPRQRTTIEEDDYYPAPRVQKYSVGRKEGLPRVFETTQYRDPYAPGGTFPKVKTTQAYGPEHLNHSKRYDPGDITFANYQTAQQQAYVATHV